MTGESEKERSGLLGSRSADRLSILLGVAGILLGSCGEPSRPTRSEDRQPAVAPAVETTTQPTQTDSRPRIVFLGDSLTAGFGLEETEAFPAIIDRNLARQGIEVSIVNAGVSGDTSAGGLSRIDWILRQAPDIVVIGLGGNDGLRGLSPEMTEANLREIASRAISVGARPILLGLKLPPNLGSDYTGRFEQIYPRLAEELGISLVPFMLEGVAGVPELNLPDGIHPTAAGQARVAENVQPWIEEALSSLQEP